MKAIPIRFYTLLSMMLFAPAALTQDQPDAAAVEIGPKTIDEQVSSHVQKLAEEELNKRVEYMSIVIDDIARFCQIDSEKKERLVLAAKGASKRSMQSWHEQAVRHFKMRVTGADPETAREILNSMGPVNFGTTERAGENESLWLESLKQLLSSDQLEKYQAIGKARQQARVAAFAAFSMAALDDFLRLSPEQRDKLTPIVDQAARDHFEDIQRYLGSVQNNLLLSLINNEKEEVLTTILSQNQFNRLREETSNFNHFWDQRRKIREAQLGAQKNGEAKPEAPAIQLQGDIQGGRIEIQAGGGVVRVRQGAIFRGGDVTIGGEKIIIEQQPKSKLIPPQNK